MLNLLMGGHMSNCQATAAGGIGEEGKRETGSDVMDTCVAETSSMLYIKFRHVNLVYVLMFEFYFALIVAI